MPRIVSPPIGELDRLSSPMTPGECRVFEFFNEHLADDWEIYVQPHLNGLRPDFVLLNPKVGIAVFEIKDWNLKALDYQTVTDQNGRVELVASDKQGNQFSKQNENPIPKIELYKREIIGLYCPRLGGKSGAAAVTAGVIFPFAEDDDVKTLFGSCLSLGMINYPAYYPLSGATSLRAGSISEIFPESCRASSKLMSEDYANDLRCWLTEPEFSAEQRQPLELDSTQRALVGSRTSSGFRRIRGPAGSGKSLVVAARAAELAREGKSVLVVSYNITLVHYLRDLAVRCPEFSGESRSRVTWLNFHLLCSRICGESGYHDEYAALFRKYGLDSALDVEVPTLTSRIIKRDEHGEMSRYDAILVDEGQDFRLHWWQLLRLLRRASGEMLLVADATQDVYGTASAWTEEAMTESGFVGRWSELSCSYRLPVEAARHAIAFVKTFLPEASSILPVTPSDELRQQDAYGQCELRWISTQADTAAKLCLEEMLALVSSDSDSGLSMNDIVFLCDSNKGGLELVELAKEKELRLCHTFSCDPLESRGLKIGFYKGDSRIKATTLHSFKGWEARAIVVLVGNCVDSRAKALVYTGLTRLKRHERGSFLTVVSCEQGLVEYGKTWPQFVEQLAA